MRIRAKVLGAVGLNRRKTNEGFPRKRILIVVICIQFIYLFNLSNKQACTTSREVKQSIQTTVGANLVAPVPAGNPIETWNKLSLCDGSMVVYETFMAVFKNMSIFKSKLSGLPGGQDIKEILNIPEKKEFYSLNKGSFSLYCPSQGEAFRRPSLQAYLGDYLKNVKFSHSKEAVAEKVFKDTTLMVTRFEYANVYWNVIESYNAYLTLRILGSDPLKTNSTLLIFDGHPKTGLDEMWKLLTPNTIRVGNLPEHTKFSRLVWQFTRNKSPMLVRNGKSLPFLKDYLALHYKRCSIKLLPRNCTQPRVLFIWRHDYVAHARNPSGLVARKITNEQQLLEHTRERYKSVKVDGVQLDSLPICEQLRMMSETDVVVGMHGAAMALVLFVQPGSSVIEIYPPSYGAQNWHMSKIAEWADVKYNMLRISNKSLEDKAKKTTIVPPSDVHNVLDRELERICAVKFSQ